MRALDKQTDVFAERYLVVGDLQFPLNVSRGNAHTAPCRCHRTRSLGGADGKSTQKDQLEQALEQRRYKTPVDRTQDNDAFGWRTPYDPLDGSQAQDGVPLDEQEAEHRREEADDRDE